DEARTALRGRHIGFVFQFHHLISAFTALENVLMPWMVANGRPDSEITDRARGLLADVGLEKYLDRRPDELSGGQQQRVAIARAPATRPSLRRAAAPPGSLDTKTGAQACELLRRFSAQSGCAVLVVTRAPRLSETCARTINLGDGKIVSDE